MDRGPRWLHLAATSTAERDHLRRAPLARSQVAAPGGDIDRRAQPPSCDARGRAWSVPLSHPLLMLVAMTPDPSIDERLTALAATQHGLLSRQQALVHGLGADQIRARVRSGRWDLLHRGVYRVAGAPETWQQRAWAAVEAAPAGAHASHLTAAALAGLDLAPPPLPHVTVGRGRSTRSSAAIVHTARLTPTDITTFQGVYATTVGRSLIDCAALLGPNRLQRLVDEALHRRLVRPEELARHWDRARLRPGRSGEVRLREALDPWQGPILPGSPPEARLRRQLVQWGFPEPELQIVIRDAHGMAIGRIDGGWTKHRIGFEYDSEEFHGPRRWANDEARQRAIEELGWELLRVDKLDLRPGASQLRDTLRRAWSRRTPGILDDPSSAA